MFFGKESVQGKYQKLSENISAFQEKGLVILQGDFNAHTNTSPDFIANDKNSTEYGSDMNISVQQRNSEDKSKIDIRGEELLQLCRSLNLHILNGRKTGDVFGKLTSHQWNGNGVVDYIISSADLFPQFTSLNVGVYSPFVSDHSPLLFKLRADMRSPEPSHEALHEIPTRFYLKEDDKAELVQKLKSRALLEKIDITNFSNDEDCGDSLSNCITETLIEAAKAAKIKPAKNNIHPNSNEPWY